MTGFGSTFADRLLDYALRGVEPPSIGSILASLHTADPGNTGTDEVAGGGYARQTVSYDAASAKSAVLGSNVSFSDMPAVWVLYIGYWTDDGTFVAGAPNGQRKDFAAAASNDVLTSTSHGYSDGMTVALLPRVGGSLPGGLTADTPYYVRDVTTHTFKLAATSGGAAIDVSSDGIGTVRRVQRMDAGDTFTLLAGTTYGLDA